MKYHTISSQTAKQEIDFTWRIQRLMYSEADIVVIRIGRQCFLFGCEKSNYIFIVLLSKLLLVAAGICSVASMAASAPEAPRNNLPFWLVTSFHCVNQVVSESKEKIYSIA